MGLGSAAAGGVRLIVWCKGVRPSGRARPPRWPLGVGAGTPFSIGASGWSAPRRGSGEIDMVVTGERR
jgi:hypothetical protein